MINYNLLFKKGAFKLSQIEKEKIFFIILVNSIFIIKKTVKNLN